MNIFQKASNFFLVDSKRQYFTVAEQILSSATSLLASIVVARYAGLEWLGIYSFMLVFVSLANSVTFTLMLRQMTLEISTLSQNERCDMFFATIVMMLVFFAGIAAVLSIALVLIPSGHWVFIYQSEIIACILIVILGSVFDACKQYFYVTNNHHRSFFYTLVYSATFVLMLIFSIALSNENELMNCVLLSFVISFFVSFFFNSTIRQVLKKAKWHGWDYVSNTFRDFFQHSRYGMGGLLVSWAQSQSIVPFLMFLAGPLVVGYFSMARLLVMPISVVNQGLMKGITPSLRRTFKEHGLSELAQSISKLDLKNLLFSVFYLGALVTGHISGLFHSYVPDYENVKWFLIMWVVTLLVTTHRFWLAQYFMVSMQFKYLLKIALLALCVSLTAMILLGYGTGNSHLAFLAVMLGELVVIYFFYKKQLLQLRQ